MWQHTIFHQHIDWLTDSQHWWSKHSKILTRLHIILLIGQLLLCAHCMLNVTCYQRQEWVTALASQAWRRWCTEWFVDCASSTDSCPEKSSSEVDCWICNLHSRNTRDMADCHWSHRRWTIAIPVSKQQYANQKIIIIVIIIQHFYSA